MNGPLLRAGGLRSLRVVTVLHSFVLLALTGLLVLAFLLNADTAGNAEKNAAVTNDALCALRIDLEKRVEASERFLREHPHGIAGIPAKTIRDGIVNQRRTIMALAGLAC